MWHMFFGVNNIRSVVSSYVDNMQHLPPIYLTPWRIERTDRPIQSVNIIIIQKTKQRMVSRQVESLARRQHDEKATNKIRNEMKLNWKINLLDCVTIIIRVCIGR